MDLNIYTVYVRLLDEGTDVSRPVSAINITGNVYVIIKPDWYDPEDEIWEFTPGSLVSCDPVRREGGNLLLATKIAQLHDLST